MEEYTSIELSGVYFECYHDDYVAETIECEHPDATHHEVCGIVAEGYAYHIQDFNTYQEACAYAESLGLPIWERR